MSWFKRENTELEASSEKRVRTEGLWVKCDGCRQVIWKKDLDQNWNVCPKCDRHFRIDARARLALLLDNGERDDSFTLDDENLASTER
jgi:acetyl-CoA carboxylase carboxyl transferase subunit beta